MNSLSPSASRAPQTTWSLNYAIPRQVLSTWVPGTDNYIIEVYINGAATRTTSVTLTGNVRAVGSFVVAHGPASTAIKATANQRSNSVNFDGDDFLVLKKGGVSGMVVDSYRWCLGTYDVGTPKTYGRLFCSSSPIR